MSKDLGQKLVEEKVITEKALSDAKDFQKQKGGRLTSALIATGALTEEQLAEFLSKFCGVPAVNLKELAIDSELIKLIPAEVARKHMLMPINRAGSTLILAMADPSHVFAQDDIKFLTGYNVEVAVASERQIKEAIEQYYKNVDEMEFLGDIDDLEMEPEKVEEINLGELEKASEEASVIKMVNGILTDAIKKGASHIHLEPAESALSVRYRIDGILYTISNLSSKMKKAVIARLKIMSGMDIAERRLWQEGNLKIKMTQNGEFSYAVSAMPTAYGEKIVLKVLDKSIYQKPLTKMGLAEKQLEILQKSLRTPGLVIVTGDDSKVTLYGILRKLNKPGVSIATIEQMIGDLISGINQTEMHEEIGLNLTSSLGALTRQNPDVIMTSDLPDYETVERALILAGQHLVLGGMQRNDAVSVICSLQNMGIEPYKISENLKLVLAQRTVRCICKKCKRDAKVKPGVLKSMGVETKMIKEGTFSKGHGCPQCRGTGFQGRMFIFEVLLVNDSIRELILSPAHTHMIKKVAIEQGMITLRQSGIQAVLKGLTTLAEIARATEAD